MRKGEGRPRLHPPWEYRRAGKGSRIVRCGQLYSIRRQRARASRDCACCGVSPRGNAAVRARRAMNYPARENEKARFIRDIGGVRRVFACGKARAGRDCACRGSIAARGKAHILCAEGSSVRSGEEGEGRPRSCLLRSIAARQCRRAGAPRDELSGARKRKSTLHPPIYGGVRRAFCRRRRAFCRRRRDFGGSFKYGMGTKSDRLPREKESAVYAARIPFRRGQSPGAGGAAGSLNGQLSSRRAASS